MRTRLTQKCESESGTAAARRKVNKSGFMSKGGTPGVAQGSHGAIIFPAQLTAIECEARISVRLAQARRLTLQGVGPSGRAFWASGGGGLRAAPTFICRPRLQPPSNSASEKPRYRT
jgi:hypothetical protein